MENKETNPNVNRAAYITILSLLAVLAVLVVMTSTANRARREEPITTDSAVTGMPGTTPPLSTTPSGHSTKPVREPETTQPETTAAPESSAAPETTAAPTVLTPNEPTPDTPVAEVMPNLLLPLSGNLIRAHDLEVPTWSNTMADYRTHCGIDIAAAPGASVCAAADGTVAQIWTDPLMGQCISLKHAGNAMTIYRGLSSVIPVGIEPGVEVRAGQLIANVGETAMIEIADEPHVHFELMVGDDYVNPLDHLSASVRTALAVDVGYEG